MLRLESWACQNHDATRYGVPCGSPFKFMNIVLPSTGGLKKDGKRDKFSIMLWDAQQPSYLSRHTQFPLLDIHKCLVIYQHILFIQESNWLVLMSVYVLYSTDFELA